MVINFDPPTFHDDSDLLEARSFFFKLLHHYNTSGRGPVSISGRPSGHDDGGFFADKLLRCLYEYSPTDMGKINVLHQFLAFVFAPSGESATADDMHKWDSASPEEVAVVMDRIDIFAIQLIQAFFLPFQSNGHKTPNVPSLISPGRASDVPTEQPEGTVGRLSGLRTKVLKRDGYRCAISGILDTNESDRRYRLARNSKSGSASNTGSVSVIGRECAVATEVAHIIPHSLNDYTHGNSDVGNEKRYIWRVMNMFDPGISSAVLGQDIDRPHNAILMQHEWHCRFGNLKCYFEKVEGSDPNTYRFKTVERASPVPPGLYPASETITFSNQDTILDIDLPDARLLRFHRACALILSMSAAGEYIDSILYDMDYLQDQGSFASDGSSDMTSFFATRGLVSIY